MTISRGRSGSVPLSKRNSSANKYLPEDNKKQWAHMKVKWFTRRLVGPESNRQWGQNTQTHVENIPTKQQLRLTRCFHVARWECIRATCTHSNVCHVWMIRIRRLDSPSPLLQPLSPKKNTQECTPTLTVTWTCPQHVWGPHNSAVFTGRAAALEAARQADGVSVHTPVPSARKNDLHAPRGLRTRCETHLA